jgi:hypothetical protein
LQRAYGDKARGVGLEANRNALVAAVHALLQALYADKHLRTNKERLLRLARDQREPLVLRNVPLSVYYGALQ